MRTAWSVLLMSLSMLSTAASAAPAPPTADSDTLAVVTLNLWHDKGDWPARQALIVDALRALQPDVVALQEVIEHERLPNQARTIAEALGYRYVFVSSDDIGKPQRYGNAILTRHAVLDTDWKKLAPLDDFRTIGRVRIAVGDRAVNVYATHLHWTDAGGAIRATQVADALDWITATADGAPSLLLGDLNAPMSAPELQALLARFADAYGAVHPGMRDDDRAHSTLRLGDYAAKHVDQVLAQRDAFAPVEARVILDRASAAGVWPSDHYGVFARVRLLPSPTADAAQPWRDTGLTPDARARALVARITRDEKLRMVRTEFGLPSDKFKEKPEGAIGSAGFMPGNPRLGIPALQETDAGLGVNKPGLSGDDGATALPSGVATAASWDPAIAQAGGAMIGRQAWRKGFNVLLAGAVNLQRDPRNGRNFEYAGEDPLLAGTMVGHHILGVQSSRVVSTLKHFAINDIETARNFHSAQIDEAALRESDLLAFELANEIGRPGSVMSAYNKINGTYAGEHDWLLNTVLKTEWGFRGWVMSDWGGAHSAAKAANAGLDQQSAGEVFDKEVYFDKPLRAALAKGEVTAARLDDMAGRVLRSMFAHGPFDHPPVPERIDFATDDAVAQRTAEAGAVLLRNRDRILPLSPTTARIVVIGSHADKGVLSGGGSSMVTPPGGPAVPGLEPIGWPGPVTYLPSSPLRAMQAIAPSASITYLDGRDMTAAARAAREADVAIVFATQWAAESYDNPTMQLPDDQDAVIAAVAAANPRTVVVLQTNGPVTMPWLESTAAVLQAWYPGARGGTAIARLLYGEVSPQGRLPVSWPRDESQLPRPWIEGAGYQSKAPPMDVVNYDIEGANVGYRWFAQQKTTPLFAFGFGLGYTTFAYDALRVERDGAQLRVFADVANTGTRDGRDVVQAYLHLPDTAATPLRLIGWQTVQLAPGERRRVAIDVDPRLLASWDVAAGGWRIAAGRYEVSVGGSSADRALRTPVELPGLPVTPGARAAMPR